MNKLKKFFVFLGSNIILPVAFAVSYNEPSSVKPEQKEKVSKQEYKAEYVKIMNTFITKYLKEQGLSDDIINASLKEMEAIFDIALQQYDDNYNFNREYQLLKEKELKLENLDVNKLTEEMVKFSKVLHQITNLILVHKIKQQKTNRKTIKI
ncbi:hypothetical protein NW072_02320 [Mycoplasmopsis felis]|uniref:hypothetical protein n=1 Tax=Mycoplasmopsis felis TaxID=33923 RepID=UPI0021AF35CF|nr:hypothetical protein [Mycoplasmopsis felis]UWV79962.1 hypothetical protein NW072_02320 [Mycoplasmopsis felis]